MIFLNSKKWRNFQENVGHKTFNLGEGFLTKLQMPFGKNYLYSNYTESPKYLEEIKMIGRAENAVFFKIEPLIVKNEIWNTQRMRGAGFLEGMKSVQPQKTIILNLNKTEEELLKKMHSKTRYNARLAKKREVEVRESQNKIKDFDKFWILLQKTAERDKFNTHTKDYYKKLLDLDISKLYFAIKDNDIHATAIMIFFENRVTYLHGASDYKYHRDMAPYLLHWEIIKEAKKQGFGEYDFWGIDEKRWPGITNFKRGFMPARVAELSAGKEIEYIGSWDMPLKKFWYKLYETKNIIEKL